MTRGDTHDACDTLECLSWGMGRTDQASGGEAMIPRPPGLAEWQSWGGKVEGSVVIKTVLRLKHLKVRAICAHLSARPSP